MTFITIILTVSGWTVRTYIMVHIISGFMLTPAIKWRSRILRTMLLNVLFMIMEATLLPTGVGLVSLTILKRDYVTAVLPTFLTTTKTTTTTSFICMTKTLQFCKIVQQTKMRLKNYIGNNLSQRLKQYDISLINSLYIYSRFHKFHDQFVHRWLLNVWDRRLYPLFLSI